MPDSLAASLGTILVVDDVQVVRKAVASTLRRANFHVLSACSGVKAIRLAKEAGGMIDLLLCSIQMHRMSGLALGEILKGTRPDLQVMLMMGGSNGDLLVLNHGWTMIEKQSM